MKFAEIENFLLCEASENNKIRIYKNLDSLISELKVSLSELTPQVEEVEALKLVSINEFGSILQNIGADNHFVPSNKSYYETVLQNIKKTGI